MKKISARNDPNHSLARFHGSSEWCVQSWNMMYVRTRNPAVGIARARVIRYEIESEKYIAAQSARKGTSDVAIDSELRPRLDLA